MCIRDRIQVEESEGIWYPRVDFDNVKDDKKWIKTTKENIFKVVPGKAFEYRAKDNMHLFQGSENGLSLTNEWSIEWICQ